MNVVDGLFLALLAVIDIAVLVYLRRNRGRRAHTERMMRSLRFAVQRDALCRTLVPPPQEWTLPRAG